MKPIRVLHILHSMNRGGAENAIMNYYRNIDREKVQFDFLLTSEDKGDFEDEITSLGGQIFKVPLITLYNPFPYIKAVRSFFESHPEYKIVHSHTSSKSVIPLWIAKKCMIPIRCCHSHSSRTKNDLHGKIRNILKPFLKYVATDLLACGEQAAIWLYGKHFLNSPKVKIFKNVIETINFKYNEETRKIYRNKFGIEGDSLLLGHTARFGKEKNHPFDIEILSEIKNMGIKTKLMLVGDNITEEAKFVKQKIEYMELQNDVIFTGVVNNVYDYEQAMDVFLLPSFFEGLPLSIIEAQVSGLPCFTSKDRVSYECSVTDLVHYIPLEAGARAWAEEIVKACKGTRRDRWDEVAAAGYDAKTSAKQLQDFYLVRIKQIMR